MIHDVLEVQYRRDNQLQALGFALLYCNFYYYRFRQALIIDSKATKDGICVLAEFCCIHDITDMQKQYWSMCVNTIMLHTGDSIKTFLPDLSYAVSQSCECTTSFKPFVFTKQGRSGRFT